jgi:hypothetical protein
MRLFGVWNGVCCMFFWVCGFLGRCIGEGLSIWCLYKDSGLNELCDLELKNRILSHPRIHVALWLASTPSETDGGYASRDGVPLLKMEFLSNSCPIPAMTNKQWTRSAKKYVRGRKKLGA